MTHINLQGLDLTLRVRLMALLALYDLLPPSLDQTTIPDFNPPPDFDSSTDIDSIVQSLAVIGRKLQISHQNDPQNSMPINGSNAPMNLSKVIESILAHENNSPRFERAATHTFSGAGGDGGNPTFCASEA